LLLSQRNLVDHIFARCVLHEFESVLQEIDATDVVAPRTSTFHEARKRFAKRLAYRTPVPVNPGVTPVAIERDYDLCLAVFGFPSDLLSLRAVRNWRARCRTAVCWIDEVLVNECINLDCLKYLLEGFDHVFVSTRQGVEVCSGLSGGSVHFLPVGVDAVKFCPMPSNPVRCIDVLSVGRRSGELHQRLLALLKRGEIFYHFASTDGALALDLDEHRLLLANMCKRSRFFLVHPGKMNMQALVGSEELIGARFFEGAAAGTIMIGRAPDSDDFRSLFNWPDAVIPLPDGPESIVDLLGELSRNTERQECIRSSNVANSLRLHDWAHRLCTILRVAGLEPHPNTVARLNALENLATVAEEAVTI
jgi:hypothetical protein